MPALTPQIAVEYKQLFDSCIIKPERYPEIDKVVQTIQASIKRYKAVEAISKVPWYFIGIIHYLEGNTNFNVHLHNGDPLTARTAHVPKGRPKIGMPPFTWEVSAVDSLQLQSLDQIQVWSIEELLFQFERYNGFGYRQRGIHSPYLWSYSNQYIKGKYDADGIFNANLVSKQCGAAVLMRRMSEKQIAVIGSLDTLSQIKTLGLTVEFAPKRYNAKAEQLQNLLNLLGLHVRIDGHAGAMTSDAYFLATQRYLRGDNR